MSRHLKNSRKIQPPKQATKAFYMMDDLTQTLFVGRPKPERLPSNQMVSQKCISSVWMHKQPIYFLRPQWMAAYMSLDARKNLFQAQLK